MGQNRPMFVISLCVSAQLKIDLFVSLLHFQAFKGMKQLQKVTLDHNKITDIQPFAFKVCKIEALLIQNPQEPGPNKNLMSSRGKH